MSPLRNSKYCTVLSLAQRLSIIPRSTRHKCNTSCMQEPQTLAGLFFRSMQCSHLTKAEKISNLRCNKIGPSVRLVIFSTLPFAGQVFEPRRHPYWRSIRAYLSHNPTEQRRWDVSCSLDQTPRRFHSMSRSSWMLLLGVSIALQHSFENR